MASNKIPGSYDILMALATQCIDGAGQVGPGIPLTTNTQQAISADRTALLNAQTIFKQQSAGLKPAYEEYHAQLEQCYGWAVKARDYLKQYLGNYFNQAWVEAGFRNSIAVERGDDFLSPLLATLQALFITHEAWQDAPHEITAAQAQTLYDALTATRSAVNATRLAASKAKETRDTAFTAMRVRLIGLCAELKQKIGLYDPRWVAFGLNIPGASTTPAVPENVTAVSYGPGQILATCDPVPNATHYRFFTQQNLVDPEPVFAGNSPTPTLVIAGLEPGKEYLVYVSAADSSRESRLSEPTSVTPIVLAAAA
jgi:hypothetical protein